MRLDKLRNEIYVNTIKIVPEVYCIKLKHGVEERLFKSSLGKTYFHNLDELTNEYRKFVRMCALACNVSYDEMFKYLIENNIVTVETLKV